METEKEVCNTTLYGPKKMYLVCTLPKGHKGKCGIIGCKCATCGPAITQKEYWVHPFIAALGKAPSNAEYWRIVKQTENGKVVYLAYTQKPSGGFAVGNKKWADAIIRKHGNLL